MMNTSDEIQELLDGSLSDERTAEILHRLSVSPEKRDAFRQHMALRGAFDRDETGNRLREEEDDAVWAAVVGATGGALTGATSGGFSGWFARAAVLLLTGVASFVIGAVSGDGIFSSDEESPAIAESPESKDPASAVRRPGTTSPSMIPVPSTTLPNAIASGSSATKASGAGTTGTAASVAPRVVYRDRIVYRDNPIDAASTAAVTRSSNDASETSPNQAVSTDGASIALTDAERDQRIAAQVNEWLGAAIDRRLNASPEKQIPALPEVPSSTMNDAAKTATEGPRADLNGAASSNDGLTSVDGIEPSENDLHQKAPDKNADPFADLGSSLVRGGIELAYNERIGRVAPAPEGLSRVDPNFAGHAFDLVYRPGGGTFGIGARLTYGSFAYVDLEQSVWSTLGISDTIFVPTLETKNGFGTEILANVRVPLFSDRLALNLESSIGLSAFYYKVGGDVGLLFLITDRLGAQAAAGLSSYWYTTEEQREKAMGDLRNTGVVSELNSSYRGSMFEGRYGLFFMF